MNLRRAFLAPSGFVLLLLFAGPALILVIYSFYERGAYGGVLPRWTWENYQRLADPLYFSVVVRSLVLAWVATALAVAAAFPVALAISRSGSWKLTLVQLVMLPFWTSLLVRTYAWVFLLRDTGLVNSILVSLDVVAEPVPLLYNEAAVVLGLVSAHLPFAILPIYAALEKVDRSVVDAAHDLGASTWDTIWTVLVPLSAPGLKAAVVLVFIPSFGAYLIPDLLGGGKSVMIGNVIQNQFTTARDWPFGSALALVLISALGIVSWTALQRGGKELL
jgi:spermidine/putrescine transport system permease protein